MMGTSSQTTADTHIAMALPPPTPQSRVSSVHVVKPLTSTEIVLPKRPSPPTTVTVSQPKRLIPRRPKTKTPPRTKSKTSRATHRRATSPEPPAVRMLPSIPSRRYTVPSVGPVPPPPQPVHSPSSDASAPLYPPGRSLLATSSDLSMYDYTSYLELASFALPPIVSPSLLSPKSESGTDTSSIPVLQHAGPACRLACTPQTPFPLRDILAAFPSSPLMASEPAPEQGFAAIPNVVPPGGIVPAASLPIVVRVGDTVPTVLALRSPSSPTPENKSPAAAERMNGSPHMPTKPLTRLSRVVREQRQAKDTKDSKSALLSITPLTEARTSPVDNPLYAPAFHRLVALDAQAEKHTVDAFPNTSAPVPKLTLSLLLPLEAPETAANGCTTDHSRASTAPQSNFHVSPLHTQASGLTTPMATPTLRSREARAARRRSHVGHKDAYIFFVPKVPAPLPQPNILAPAPSAFATAPEPNWLGGWRLKEATWVDSPRSLS